jgi:hypothetical protein
MRSIAVSKEIVFSKLSVSKQRRKQKLPQIRDKPSFTFILSPISSLRDHARYTGPLKAHVKTHINGRPLRVAEHVVLDLGQH